MNGPLDTHRPGDIRLVTRGVAVGVDTRLSNAALPGLGLGETVPSTAEIGRLFLQFDASALPLLNPLARVGSDFRTVLEPSIGELMISRFNRLRVLNYGCGGATDVPLLHRLLHERLGDNQTISIRNFDLSESVVELVRAGAHPHFKRLYRLDHQATPCDEMIVSRLERYATEEFISQGTRCVADLGANEPTEIAVEVFSMRPEIGRSIEIGYGDVRAIDAPAKSAEVILCFNVGYYLTPKDKWFAFGEIERVLQDGGFFLSNAAIFEKQGGRLVPVSGYEERGYGRLSEGVHPTILRGGRYLPVSIRHFLGYGMGYAKMRPHDGETFFGAQIDPDTVSPAEEELW